MSFSSKVDGLYGRSMKEDSKVTKLSIEKIVEMRDLFVKCGGKISSRIYEEEGVVLFRPSKSMGEGYEIKFGHGMPLQLIAPEGVYSIFGGLGVSSEYGKRMTLGFSFAEDDNLERFHGELEDKYNIPEPLRAHNYAEIKNEAFWTVAFSGRIKI